MANSNLASMGTIIIDGWIRIIDGWIRIDLYSLRFQANLTMFTCHQKTSSFKGRSKGCINEPHYQEAF